MYLFFFIWSLYSMVLKWRANLLLGALEGVGPGNLDFFGPKWHSLPCCNFRAQKSLDFHGPTLTMALVMGIARLKIITSRAITTTGYINSYNLQRAMSRPQTAAPAAPAPSQLVISDPNRLIPVQAWPENTLHHYSTFRTFLTL
jgi:hypothetical protein